MPFTPARYCHRMPRQRKRVNNFDGLRLLAASAVLVGHAVPLTGRGDPPTIAGVPFFDLAVYAFFSMSGFLIATSWVDRPQAWSFFRRRTLRIFPALIAVVVLCVFALGPAFTTLRTSEYFASADTWTYLSNVTLMASYDLPGVFEDNPIGVVNGSLWTLGPEFICYLLVLAVGLGAGRWAHASASRFRLVSYLVLGSSLGSTALLFPTLGKGIVSAALAMVYFFAAAALAEIAHGRGRLPLWPLPGLFIVWAASWYLVPGSFVALGWLVFPYVLIAIGQVSLPLFRRAARFGDASYGIYLWAFPVQQAVWLILPNVPLAINISIVAVTAALFGYASWHLIEKRALAFARRKDHAEDRRHAKSSEIDPLALPHRSKQTLANGVW